LDQTLVNLLNGLSAGLLLFMLCAGLTLIFSMMGVLNFAHASFYMLGAYAGYSVARVGGFWIALVLAPLAVGLLGALFERFVLRRVRVNGPVPELLVTFGLSYVVLEAVQLAWGRAAVPFDPPAALQGPALTLVHSATGGLDLFWRAAPEAVCSASGVSCSLFPATRAFIAVVALAMLGGLAWLLVRTRTGLILRAALTHATAVEALGHDVPRIFTWVFAGGCALAALAGVAGGVTFVTEPAMAATVGTILFVVVVVGGMGSLKGAFVAAILIGLLQYLPVAWDVSLLTMGRAAGFDWGPETPGHAVLKITLAQLAPLLPYLLLVAMLIARPRGLFGTHGD
jgi:branched-chain amino acid transport system permease protein